MPARADDETLFTRRQGTTLMGAGFAILVIAIAIAIALRAPKPRTPAGYVNVRPPSPIADAVGDPLPGVTASGSQTALARAVAQDMAADQTLIGGIVAPQDPSFQQSQAGDSCGATSTRGLVSCTWVAGRGGGRGFTAAMLVRVGGSSISNIYVAAANANGKGELVLTPAL
jgi:hypothetical protein